MHLEKISKHNSVFFFNSFFPLIFFKSIFFYLILMRLFLSHDPCQEFGEFTQVDSSCFFIFLIKFLRSQFDLIMGQIEF